MQTRLQAFAENVCIDFKLFHKLALESFVEMNRFGNILK